MDDKHLAIDAVRSCRAALGEHVLETPTVPWNGAKLRTRIDSRVEVLLKLELFQYTGSFKPRGALNVLQCLSATDLGRGVTAVSAGNHAIATAYAAKIMNTSAKVVMAKTASPARVARAVSYGAEVVLADDPASAFRTVDRIAREEGRALVHPFEGPRTAQGTATIGVELSDQAGELDAVVIPIGGGGLCAGMAAAIKQLQPGCAVYGVEPTGADVMNRSFRLGAPATIESHDTIADSLSPPMTLPYSFALCREYIDQIVLVSDDELRNAMRLLFDEMKIAVEPAGAASTAALIGPLRERLRSGRVGLIASGANIDIDGFSRHTLAGASTDEIPTGSRGAISVAQD